MIDSAATDREPALTAREATPVAAPTRWRRIGHCVGNVVLALLWSNFALNTYTRWVSTGSLMLLGLVLYNTLLVAVTIARRPSVSTSTQLRDWVAAVLTVTLSLLFRPGQWHQLPAQTVGSILQAMGLVIMVVALTTLGRSFGVVAANRGVRRSGIYGWVRHPLYSGELFLFTGFLLSNASLYNFTLWFSIVCGLLLRSWAEETHLIRDPAYRTYMRAVRYRFFPGLL